MNLRLAALLTIAAVLGGALTYAATQLVRAPAARSVDPIKITQPEEPRAGQNGEGSASGDAQRRRQRTQRGPSSRRGEPRGTTVPEAPSAPPPPQTAPQPRPQNTAPAPRPAPTTAAPTLAPAPPAAGEDDDDGGGGGDDDGGDD